MICVCRPGHVEVEVMTISKALELCRDAMSVESNEQLRCETAEPFMHPFPGVHVWVWSGEFDADSACILAVPLAVAEIWAHTVS